VWHKSADSFMLYPSYPPPDVPHAIHYGLQYSLDGWEFDKHFYFDFDPFKCPPWPGWQGYAAPKLRGAVGDALAAARSGPPPKPAVEHPKEGIFPPPPHPARAANDTKPYLDRYRDLLSVFTVAQINAALCEFHAATCPHSAQLEAVCGDAWELYLDARDLVDELEWSWGCANHNKECAQWAKSGECEKSKAYMSDHCAPACGQCAPRAGAFARKERRPLQFAAPKAGAAAGGEGDGGGGGGGGGGGDEGGERGAGTVVPPVETVEAEGRQKQQEEGEAGGAAAAAAAAGAGAAAAAGAGGATDAQLRARYPSAPSGSLFPDLMRRCSASFDPPLDDAALALCVRAATLRLEYHRAAGKGGLAGKGGGAAADAGTLGEWDGGSLGSHGGGGGAAGGGGGGGGLWAAQPPFRPGDLLKLGSALEAELVAGGLRAEEALEASLRARGVRHPGRVLLEVAAGVAAALLVLLVAARRCLSRRGGARLPVGGGNYVQLIKPTGSHRSD
jgi:hypothetical protein